MRYAPTHGNYDVHIVSHIETYSYILESNNILAAQRRDVKMLYILQVQKKGIKFVSQSNC